MIRLGGALLLAICTGCQPPDPSTDAQAIEITGYLDASRVSFTELDGRVQAAGRTLAVLPGAQVQLRNDTAATAEEVLASDLGAFVVSIDAEAGDRVVVAVADAPPEDEAVHDVPTEPPAFPEPLHALASPDPHDPHVAVVELEYDPPLTGGHVWASNPATHDVVLLGVFLDGAVHGGQLHGADGDWLVLHWVPAAGPESRGYELQVRPLD